MYSLPGPYSGHVDFDTSSNANSSCSHRIIHFKSRRTTSTDTANRCRSFNISTTAAITTARAPGTIFSSRTDGGRASAYNTSDGIYGNRYE